MAAIRRSCVVVVMGPAGAGKSTVGALAAAQAGAAFYEGDDFHPPENLAKIKKGQGLTQEDRVPWIAAIGATITRDNAPKAVLACSALNGVVRASLCAQLPTPPNFVLLDVPEAELRRRLTDRQGHFAGVSLLKSQLAAMDAAEGVPRLNGLKPPEELAAEIAQRFERCEE